MKKIITKEILNENLEIHSRIEPPPSLDDPIFISKPELLEKIGRAKNYLLKEKKFARGDCVILATTQWPAFLVWFIAVSELGGSFLVTDSPAVATIDVFKSRLSIYNKIDHIIYYSNNFPVEQLGMTNISIEENIYDGYEFSQESLDLILSQESDILLYSLSSGTTDTPKVISHTHKFFYDLIDRNAKVFNLKNEDRCLHSKNLHHGSILGVYLLPTLKHCRYHYFQSFGELNFGKIERPLKPYIDMLKRFKINRCMIYWTHILHQLRLELKPDDFDYEIQMGYLSQFDAEDLKYVCGLCGHRVISIFGCTESSGPLFLKEISRDNIDSLDFNNFGKPLDDFYKLEIDDRSLKITMPDESIVYSGDYFEIENGNFIHGGRQNGIKIKGIPIYLPILVKLIKNFAEQYGFIFDHAKEFDIVVDKTYSLIYLRSDVPFKLKRLNKFLFDNSGTDAYNISNIVVGDRTQFISGIKLDAEHIRIISRNFLKSKNKLRSR